MIGLQDQFLIFLDPHNTEDAIPCEIDEIKKKHMSYHESNAKKIHFTKLDPSFGFCFLLKNEQHFEEFKRFMTLGKAYHKGDWIFQTMQSKPDFSEFDTKPKKKKKKKAKATKIQT